MPLAIRSWILFHWALDTTGPMVVSGASGAPALTLAATALAISATSSMRLLGTNMRVGALQDCPVLFMQDITPWATIFSKFTSRSEERTSELQSRPHLVCRLLLEKKKKKITNTSRY